LKEYGIMGGKGNPRRLREHILHLRTRLQSEKDPAGRTRLQQRIGRLMGGSATLYVGADSQPQVESRRDIARRASEAMRCALRTGVVAGGGIALLSCRAPLQRRLATRTEPDERAAYIIVCHALEAPFRTLLTNAGYDPAEYIGQIDGTGTGFDLQTGKLVNMLEAGIVDPAGVVQSAAQVALSGAAQALTVDVLVHHRKREESLEP
jgi:chaperonin GroEL